MTVLAHGVGQSQDLPLPLDLVLQAGAATVVVSFLVVALYGAAKNMFPSPETSTEPTFEPSPLASTLNLPRVQESPQSPTHWYRYR